MAGDLLQGHPVVEGGASSLLAHPWVGLDMAVVLLADPVTVIIICPFCGQRYNREVFDACTNFSCGKVDPNEALTPLEDEVRYHLMEYLLKSAHSRGEGLSRATAHRQAVAQVKGKPDPELRALDVRIRQAMEWLADKDVRNG